MSNEDNLNPEEVKSRILDRVQEEVAASEGGSGDAELQINFHGVEITIRVPANAAASGLASPGRYTRGAFHKHVNYVKDPNLFAKSLFGKKAEPVQG